MKITDLKTYVVANPPPHRGGPYFVFLKLTTDDNVHGFGEVYGVPFGPSKVTQLIEDVVDRHVIGWDPFNIEKTVADSLLQRLRATPGPDLSRRVERNRNSLLGYYRKSR